MFILHILLNKQVKEKRRECSYHPTLLASNSTSDCIGLFETILEQYLGNFHGITVKTTLHPKEKQVRNSADMYSI